MAVIDNYDLRATLRAIYKGDITADEAKGILDVTRRAAAADQKSDIAEMTMLLRLKDLVAQMAGETDVVVTGKAEPVYRTQWTRGPRELAYACAFLVMVQDLDVTVEESALANGLGDALIIPAERAQALKSQMEQLVRSART